MEPWLVAIDYCQFTYTSYELHLPFMFSLVPQKPRIPSYNFSMNTFQKCKPAHFKIYLYKWTLLFAA